MSNVVIANTFATQSGNVPASQLDANFSVLAAYCNTLGTIATQNANAVAITGGAITGTSVAGYAPLASPTFTGNPAGPTAAPGTNTTELATTEFVHAAVAAVSSVKAWATFDGTAGVGVITPLASAGISAITKTGTGEYSITFTSAQPDANYSVAGSCAPAGSGVTSVTAFANNSAGVVYQAPTTGGFKIITVDGNVVGDNRRISLHVIGN